MQWVDDEDSLQTAIDACPVECIHWVQKQDLPALEHVMQRVLLARVNVGVMMVNQGRFVEDVFSSAARFLKQRKEK